MKLLWLIHAPRVVQLPRGAYLQGSVTSPYAAILATNLLQYKGDAANDWQCLGYIYCSTVVWIYTPSLTFPVSLLVLQQTQAYVDAFM